MVSFRHYLVTIVAIFLALGLGVLAGTTVVNQSLVEGLRDRTEQLQRDFSEQRDEVSRVRQDNDALTAFAEEARSFLAPGRLSGRQVVIVTQEAVDESARAQALDALDQANADTLAIIIVRPEMAAAEAADRERLAQILGTPVTTPSETLARQAADQLARRLAQGGSQRVGDSRPDLLEELVADGFVQIEGSAAVDSSASDIGGPDQATVVVGGGEQELAPSARDFLLPLTDGLVEQGAQVAAAQGSSTSYPFVSAIRSPDGFGNGEPMITVDNVDQAPGGLALVLGLERLLDLGEGGHYGLGGNADGVIPPLAGA